MAIAAQSTLWKHKNWEARISEQGCLEQIVFKENGRKDFLP